MSEPIIIINREAIQYEEVTEEWSYDKILELFPDGDGSLVNPLVRRCQKYEAKIEQLCNIEEDLRNLPSGYINMIVIGVIQILMRPFAAIKKYI